MKAKGTFVWRRLAAVALVAGALGMVGSAAAEGRGGPPVQAGAAVRGIPPPPIPPPPAWNGRPAAPAKGDGFRTEAAVSLTVTNTNDSGTGSLRAAIATANGDTSNSYTITFNLTYPATITLTSGALGLTTGMTIQGPGASNLTVSGNDASQVFVLTGGTSTISGLTVTHGKVTSGFDAGGIQVNNGATLGLDHCVVQNCAGYTGGVKVYYGTLNVTACTFSGNQSNGYGGGVEFAYSSSGGVSGCTFTGNTSFSGSGVGMQDCTGVSVTNSTFQGNTNTGGAGWGTLVFVVAQATSDLNDSVMNCTVTQGFDGAPSGSGLTTYLDSGTYHITVALQNTVVWADQGGFTTYQGGTFVDGGYNFDSDGTSGFTDGVNGDIVGTAGSPLNPLLGPLANNGGPVETMALLPGSRCIDAGDPNFTNSAPTLDARGASRTGPDADGNGDGTSAPDIGAYEYQRYVVVNTNDSGAGSLRDAIDHTNTYAGEVAFAIGSQGSQQTISPASSLPPIFLPTFVDGWSQGGPAYKGPPLVRVDGASAGQGAIGLNIQASNTTVRGLDVTGFQISPSFGNGIGIGIFGTLQSVWIYGCYVGVGLDGVTPAGNGQIGIWEGAGPSQVLIGTNADGVNDAAERNVIADNASFNVLLQGADTAVAGNYIGLGADGTTGFGTGVGVRVLSSGNTIGGTAAGAGNVISGNGAEGVSILIDHTTVQGNDIGTSADGLSPVGNGGAGVVIYSAADTDNLVARNVICANGSDGISVYGGASYEMIQGNYIGVGANGATPMGNAGQGVTVTGSQNSVSDNVIAANQRAGVYLQGALAANNVVAGNLIGVDVTGLVDAGNAGPGVQIDGGANHNRIGTDPSVPGDYGERNVIACNDRDGGGIYAANANVLFLGSGTDNNLVAGNFIGLNATGSATFSPNGGPRGVLLYAGPSSNTIGGTQAWTRNVISGNQHTGVEFAGTGTNGNVVEGNYLGTDATGKTAIGNNYGVQVWYTGNAGNQIGGAAPAEGNVISGNHANGVNLVDSTTQGTSVQGNWIGVAADGTTALGNASKGVALYGSSDCLIGGAAAGTGNTIAFNGAQGIAVYSGTGDTFEENSIHDNGGLGIDLGGDGVTPNHPGGPNAGPNDLQNYPLLTVSPTAVSGTLNSAPNTTFRIEVFASPTPDPSGYGEGQTYLGFTTAATDGSGNASFSFPYTSGSQAPAITATATNLTTGDTSEFSAACGVVTIAPSTLPTGTVGAPYSQQFTASMAVPGGGGFTFALASGSSLPAGFSLSAAGLLSGTPTAAGTYDFTVIATDSNGCTGTLAVQVYISLYDTSLLDDYGRSEMCANSHTGDWSYTVLKGNGAGDTFTGTGTVQTGSGYFRITASPGSGFGLSLIDYTTAHRATATFTYRPDAVSSALYDQNTLDDPPTCTAPPV